MAGGERFCSICGRDSSAGDAAPQVDPAVAFGLSPETSGKAIFSLISGFIFVFFPFSIAAVVFGYLALYDIRKSPGRLTGRGLAISGIVLGYLGVALTITMLGLGIYGVRTAQKRINNRTKIPVASNENSPVSALRALNTAEIAYSQAHRAVGYTCSLSDLSGVWTISHDLASGKKNGYVFALQGCAAAKSDGPIMKYQLVAYPASSAKGGAAYCSDQSDVIRVARSGSADDCLKTGVDLSESEISHPQAWSQNSSR